MVGETSPITGMVQTLLPNYQCTEIRVSDPLTFSHTHRFSHIWPAILYSSIRSHCFKNELTKPTTKLYSADIVSSSDFPHPTNTDDGPNWYRV